MDSIIDLQNVSVKRGDALLINNVSWQVRKGEH